MMQPMHWAPAERGTRTRVDWQSGLLWLRAFFGGLGGLAGGAERHGEREVASLTFKGPARRKVAGRNSGGSAFRHPGVGVLGAGPGRAARAFLTPAGSQIPGVCALGTKSPWPERAAPERARRP